MRRLILAFALLFAGCFPSSFSKLETIDCTEFSVELPTGWKRGKERFPEGVHLVTLEDSGHTLVNFYVYPQKSRNTASELNDHFFGELSPALKAQGTLTSTAPVKDKLLGREAVTRSFSFSLPRENVKVPFQLHTLRLDRSNRVLFVHVLVRDWDRRRVLKELSGILDSIKELTPAHQQPNAEKSVGVSAAAEPTP